MGLNKADGETLPVIGKGKVASIEKWADVLGMLDVASQAAAANFIKQGAARPIKFTADNILIQEYHLLQSVVWIFWLPIKGIDHYDTYTFKLGDAVIGELALTGKWPAIYAMPPGAKAN